MDFPSALLFAQYALAINIFTCFITNMQIQNIQTISYCNSANSPNFKSWTREVLHKNSDQFVKRVKHRNDTWLFRDCLDWKRFGKFIVDKYKDVPKVNVINYACSNGSEAYTFLMEMFCHNDFDTAMKFTPILAKDYDQKAIDYAQSGIIRIEKGEKGTVAVNKILTPVIIIITVAIFVYAFFGISKETFNISKLVYNPSTSAFVYVSYNTLGIIAVFTSVSNLVKNKTTAVLGALAGGFMLLITALCLWYILSTNNFEGAKIPVLAALDQLGKIIYMPVLFCAMVTTAVSCGFAVIKAVGMNENATIVLMILASYMISCIGFERLVADVYAIFGYIGFVIGIYTIIDGIKYLKR